MLQTHNHYMFVVCRNVPEMIIKPVWERQHVTNIDMIYALERAPLLSSSIPILCIICSAYRVGPVSGRYIYIYIYIYTQREIYIHRERDIYTHTHTHTGIYNYIYIYIYICLMTTPAASRRTIRTVFAWSRCRLICIYIYIYIYICLYMCVYMILSSLLYVCLLGWHYLSSATCMIWPRLFYALLIVSRITLTCHMLCHF